MRKTNSSKPAIHVLETVLKPIFNTQKCVLNSFKEGDNAISFEISGVSSKFKPNKDFIVEVKQSHTESFNKEGYCFYLLKIAGKLVRLTLFKSETSVNLTGHGAVYTGNDIAKAESFALKQANYFS